MRVFTWVPPAMCAEIADGLNALLANWATTWGLPAPGPVTCEPMSVDAVDAQDFIDLRDPPPRELKRSLAQALFKLDLLGSSVVDEVVRRVIELLAGELAERFTLGALDDGEHGPLGDRGVRIAFEMLEHRCGFVLTCSQLRASGKLVVPAAEPMAAVNLEHALAETPVPLVAELGRAQIQLDELMQLAPGDVLVLNELLDAPLRITAPGSALELSAHLGAFANPPQRAVRWLAS